MPRFFTFMLYPSLSPSLPQSPFLCIVCFPSFDSYMHLIFRMALSYLIFLLIALKCPLFLHSIHFFSSLNQHHFPHILSLLTHPFFFSTPPCLHLFPRFVLQLCQHSLSRSISFSGSLISCLPSKFTWPGVMWVWRDLQLLADHFIAQSSLPVESSLHKPMGFFFFTGHYSALFSTCSVFFLLVCLFLPSSFLNPSSKRETRQVP